MLDELERDQSIELEAVIGFWPAYQVNENDVVVLEKDGNTAITTLNFLRQQKPQGIRPNFSLADFVSPEKRKTKIMLVLLLFQLVKG